MRSTHADYYGDVCELPFYNSSLQYGASSHVHEHSPNPLKALKEWFRVLRHGGFIYMVIPDKSKTFDHPRPLTKVSHMLDDYINETTMSDPTHIEDFTYGVDWKEFSPDSDLENEQKERDELAAKYHQKLNDDGEINIHFHTFESRTGLKLIETGNKKSIWPGQIQVVELIEDFPEPDRMGFLIVAQVRKRLRYRTRTLLNKKGLRQNARKF
jgi:SAM-dependent methyltransferase